MMNWQQILLGVIVLLVIYLYYQRSRTSNNRVILTIFQTNKSKTRLIDRPDNSSNTDKPINFVGGAPIDLNGNDQKAIFIGAGRGQPDRLLVEKDGKLIDIIEQTNLSSLAATYAAVSADMDHNGLTDLVVARENGVYLYLNHGRGRFEIRQLLKPSRNAIPVSLAVTDYNKDGHADLYVSQYLHPRLQNKDLLQHGQSIQNVLLEGLGRGMFEDVTQRTGSGGDQTGSTRSALWVDLDGDKLPDLVMTQDTGELEIYRNTRGASGAKFTSGPQFKKVKVPTGLGYQMAVATGDYDNDGDMDLYLSNVGTPLGAKRPDQGGRPYTGGKRLEKQLVLRNDGKFNFSPVKPNDQSMTGQNVNLGWGAIMEDLNLDGHQELIGASSLVDLNQDGHQEVFWLNASGPHKMAVGSNQQNNNWVGVRLPDDTQFFNSTIKVVSVDDRTGKIRRQSKQHVVGSGSGSDTSKIVKFGLGQDTRILQLEVTTIYDGNRWVHPNPKINMIATFRDMRSNYYTAR